MTNRFPPRVGVPEWIFQLPVQQQTVLMLAGRGPDGIAKHHPCKDIVRAYRGTVFKAAYYGRSLRWGEEADNFMTMDLIANFTEWRRIVKTYFSVVDELPHHYHMHLLHAAQILGYKHPDEDQRSAWNFFYMTAVDDAHMEAEGEATMDMRLNDWEQVHWGDVDKLFCLHPSIRLLQHQGGRISCGDCGATVVR